ALLMVVVAVGGRYLFDTLRSSSRLRAAIARLDRDDPGWQLADIEAARADVPERKNSARIVVSAHKLLPRAWPDPKSDEQLSGLLPPFLLRPDQIAAVERELARIPSALAEVRRLRDRPTGRHNIHYPEFVLGTLLEDQQNTRTIVNLLRYDGLKRAQDG